jgi:hypothetical protein
VAAGPATKAAIRGTNKRQRIAFYPAEGMIRLQPLQNLDGTHPCHGRKAYSCSIDRARTSQTVIWCNIALAQVCAFLSSFLANKKRKVALSPDYNSYFRMIDYPATITRGPSP